MIQKSKGHLHLDKKLFDDLQVDYKKALDTGKLYFNKEVLEYKMIYPTGIVPPKHVVADLLESYGPCILLVFFICGHDIWSL